MLLPYIAALFLVIAYWFGSSISDAPQKPEYRAETIRYAAEQFSMYRGLVNLYEVQNPTRPLGDIPDIALSPPPGWNFPTFHHAARASTDGNTYVWTEVGGAMFHEVGEASSWVAGLCIVTESRQCISPVQDYAVISATEMPAFIPTGSTVYVRGH